MENLLSGHYEDLNKLKTATQILNWAVKNEINKKISLIDFKKQLQEIGIDFKKLKRNTHENQTYNDDLSEVRVRGVSKKISKQLFNISKNLGVDISSILKPKIRELVDSYPEKLKSISFD